MEPARSPSADTRVMIALTRPVPPSIGRCELTHLERQPIDVGRASAQHEAYEAALRSLGCAVTRLASLPDHPDSVFVEDTALVLDECAVVTRPGAASRLGELPGVEAALRPLRRLYHIEAPGTLDGGDVLRVDRRLYVGASSRSNEDGTRQLADAVAPYGYVVKRVPIRGCLHLKSAVSALPDGTLLLNPDWVDGASFDGAGWMCVHPGEPEAANVLVVDDTVIIPASAPRTRQALESAGYRTMALDASELAKAEGALTCCSLLIGSRATASGTARP